MKALIRNQKNSAGKKDSGAGYITQQLPDFSQNHSVNLSLLVDQVITEFIGGRPSLKASFEVENNIFVRGDYSKLSLLLEKIISCVFTFNFSSRHHSIVFGKSNDGHKTYFIGNNELGNSSNISFGSFKYLDKKDLGSELQEIQTIVKDQNGKFLALGKKGIGSIVYFSIGE